MNSMKRRGHGRAPGKYSHKLRISPSFTPRWTTQLILIGSPGGGGRVDAGQDAGDGEALSVEAPGRGIVQ